MLAPKTANGRTVFDRPARYRSHSTEVRLTAIASAVPIEVFAHPFRPKRTSSASLVISP